jgi:hypothetical protein
MPQPNSLLLESSIIAGAQAAGINDIANISVADGMFLELEGTAKRWSIMSINPAGAGSYIVVRTVFGAGENDDGFYTTTALPSGLVNYDWSVFKKGLPLETQEDVAEALAAQAQYFAHRRIRHVVLKEAAQNFTGTEDIVSSIYMCAAYAALAAQRNPQQGFTNLPIAGFTKVFGTNDSFSEALLDAVAGGGNFIIVQPNAGGNIFCRHQLTTDPSSVETRECSIGRVLDFTAYTMRDGTRQMIGTFNITPTFLDQLSTIIQGLLEFLREGGVLLSANLNNLVQDVDDPTTLLVEITLEVPFPANYIKITLVI